MITAVKLPDFIVLRLRNWGEEGKCFLKKCYQPPHPHQYQVDIPPSPNLKIRLHGPCKTGHKVNQARTSDVPGRRNSGVPDTPKNIWIQIAKQKGSEQVKKAKKNRLDCQSKLKLY